MKNLRELFLCLILTLPTLALETRDIFTNTTQTRRPAVNEDFEMALGLGGCAGFLLGPNIGGSAAHCKKSGTLKSGMALRDSLPDDGRIGRTLEIGSAGTYDYWIFEIQWTGGAVPHGMHVIPSIHIEKDQLKVGSNEVADKIFTLGFPVDISHGKLIHSWGYGKSNGTDNWLKNNISLINGNSGGGIWRYSDNMLVSIVSGGPHAFGQPGWNNNDWNDPKHWNVGSAMWKIYQKSPVLKDIFPGGINKFKNGIWAMEAVSLAHWIRNITQGR